MALMSIDSTTTPVTGVNGSFPPLGPLPNTPSPTYPNYPGGTYPPVTPPAFGNDGYTNSRGAKAVSLLGRGANGGYNAFTHVAETAPALKAVGDAARTGWQSGGFMGAVKGIAPTLKPLGQAVLKGTRISAVVGAAVSVVSNGVDLLNGQISGGRFLGNVVADTGSSVVSGAVAAGAGGLASLSLAAAGVAGLPLTIGVIAVGAIGYLLTDGLIAKIGIKKVLSNSIAHAFGG